MEKTALSVRFKPILDPVAGILSANKIEGYLVGGLVRDTLLRVETNDIDLVVRTDAHKLSKTLATSLSGTFVSLDMNRDIARIVGVTEESPYVIDVARLDDDINIDLGRRDFTIDAMAIPIDEQMYSGASVLDPFHGQKDIGLELIRAIDTGIFRRDPVRLMRAIRLSASLNFELEPSTDFQIRQDAHLLTSASHERIRQEFLVTLGEANALSSLRLMDDLGLLSEIIPELDDARGIVQPKEHAYDVFNHMIETVGFVEKILDKKIEGDLVHELLPRFKDMDRYFDSEATDMQDRRTLLKFTALLHDIAKPVTKSIEQSGRVRFFEHSSVGETMAEVIMSRLRFGRKGVRQVGRMIRHHLRPGQMAAKGELPTKRAIHRYFRDLGDVALDTLYLNMADFLAARGSSLTKNEMVEQAKVMQRILDVGIELKRQPAEPKRIVDGNDIMDKFGLQPGPLIGRTLDFIEESEAIGEVNTREEAIRLANRFLKSEGDRA